MIPKIIHTVWFSDAKDSEDSLNKSSLSNVSNSQGSFHTSNTPDVPAEVRDCMESWKMHLPDYEIKIWNAENYDFSLCPYAGEAYELGRYAFASDYVRLWALYQYGGIYFDSDIQVVKNFDHLLKHKAFAGFEDYGMVATCVLASEEKNPLLLELLEDYRLRHFRLGKGLYDLTPNTIAVTRLLRQQGLRPEPVYQELEHITVYPMEYFCPENPFRKTSLPVGQTDQTVARHLFMGTWKKEISEEERRYLKKQEGFQRLFGEYRGQQLCRTLEMTKCWGLRYAKLQRERDKYTGEHYNMLQLNAERERK